MTKYLGIPWKKGEASFESCDCWGLIKLVFDYELGVHLTAESVVGNRLANAREIKERLQGDGWQRLAEPSLDFQLVAMGRNQEVHHLGLWSTVDGGLVLHSNDNQKVTASTLTALKTFGWSLIRFYQYQFND